MDDVRLIAVDEAVLADLVAVAVGDAAADEVTPPLTEGPEWTDDRVAWLRALHRDRRGGLDGPAGEATWAVTVAGRAVGSVRLKRTDADGVLETGIWLARSARGGGLGAQAIGAVLREAAAAGARTVRADTTAGNEAALALLARLGFDLTPGDQPGAVRAEIVLDV